MFLMYLDYLFILNKTYFEKRKKKKKMIQDEDLYFCDLSPYPISFLKYKNRQNFPCTNFIKVSPLF